MKMPNGLDPISGIQLMSKMRAYDAVRFFLRRYWHAFLFLIFPLLVMQFALLERYIVPEYWVGCPIDQRIQFLPVFVVPYVLWFPIVAVVLITLCFCDRGDFARTIFLLYAGMAAALVVYIIFPHGQLLRPIVTEDGFFSRAVLNSVYANDTNTNCNPSIHVLNQLAIHIGFCKSKMFRGRKGWKIASLIMTVLICASTVFIKQHSIIDVVMACLIEIPLYILIFKVDWAAHLPERIKSFALRMAKKLKLEGNFE